MVASALPRNRAQCHHTRDVRLEAIDRTTQAAADDGLHRCSAAGVGYPVFVPVGPANEPTRRLSSGPSGDRQVITVLVHTGCATRLRNASSARIHMQKIDLRTLGNLVASLMRMSFIPQTKEATGCSKSPRLAPREFRHVRKQNDDGVYRRPSTVTSAEHAADENSKMRC